MGIRKHVFEAMHVIREPVTAEQLHARARELRYSPENIECAMRALVRRGIAIEIPSPAKRRGMPSKFVLAEHAAENVKRCSAGGDSTAKERKLTWLVVVTPEDEPLDERIARSLRHRGYRVAHKAKQDGCHAVRFVREVAA